MFGNAGDRPGMQVQVERACVAGALCRRSRCRGCRWNSWRRWRD